jgi:hypothetical protein
LLNSSALVTSTVYYLFIENSFWLWKYFIQNKTLIKLFTYILFKTESFSYKEGIMTKKFTSILLLIGMVGCNNSSEPIDWNTSCFEIVCDTLNSLPLVDAGADQSALEGTNVTLSATATDSDGSIVSYIWSEGVATLSNVATFNKSDFSVGMHTIICTVIDNEGAMASDTVNITINELVNQAPVADNQNITMDKNTQKTIILTGTDANADALTFTLLSYPSHGILTGLAPNITYKPTTDYYGIDSFSFKVNDGVLDSFPKVVSITVKNICNLLHKTGQTISYDSDGNEVIDGSVKDDGFYKKGITRSYTRDNDKQTVTDNVTGLMWQDDTESGSVKKLWISPASYAANDYRNTTGDTAATYCIDLTLGDYYDWRLPTIEELVYLSDKGKGNPAIDSIFKNIISDFYWSSTYFEGQSMNAWCVNYNDGFDYPHTTGSYKNFVRCVRNE